jgi:hypothetical protein
MIKIAGGYKKFGLGDERFLHAQSYQILPPLGILKLCGGLNLSKAAIGAFIMSGRFVRIADL